MILVDRDEGEEHVITPGTLHILDDADNHTIKPVEDSTFLCIFTPPSPAVRTTTRTGSIR